MNSNINPAYWDLPQGLSDWAETLKTYTYEKASQIYLETEDAHHFYYLKSGRVQIYVTSETGNEKTLVMYQKNAIFGEAAFFDGSPRTSSARTTTKCEIIPIGRHEILTFFQQQPAQALSMIESLARTVRNLSTQIHEIAFLPAETRIARFLLTESENGTREIHYTHDEIASQVGCSHVTVSRALAEFRRAGAIETKYGKIRVTDAAQLTTQF